MFATRHASRHHSRLTRLRATALIGVGLIAGSASCASDPDVANPFRGEVPAREQNIRVFVENLDFNDATLHAIADGTRERLGTVSGKQEASFTLDWSFPRDLRIQISVLAGGNFTTPRLAVSPGERVRLVIQRPLNRSYLIR